MLKRLVLPLCMFMSGYCGIVTELSLFQLAEALLGSTITNLLYTMGVMMFFMGIGAWMSNGKILSKASLNGFIYLEAGLSLAVSTTIPLITYLAGISTFHSTSIFIFFSALIGLFIGMEIPIMQKLIEEETNEDIQKISSSVMMADYFGGLVGFAAFSLILLHTLGLASSTLSASCANLLSASLIFLFYKSKLLNFAKFCIIISIAATSFLWFNIQSIMDYAEQNLYAHKIIWSKQTPYQKLILTDNHQVGNPKYDQNQIIKNISKQKNVQTLNLDKNTLEIKQDVRNEYSLYINGGLQFNTYDEAYYHEFLVHPAVHLIDKANSVLVLGGGDGMAIRELLKHDSIQKITLVDFDSQMLKAFKENPLLRKFNQNSLNSPRLKVIHDDAWNFIRAQNRQFDLIIADFPDPHHTATAKLYSLQFYKLLKNNLGTNGIFITQSTSPLLDNKAFLCIKKTIEAVGFNTLSCHIEMESFFQWGFHIASTKLTEDSMKHKLHDINIKVSTTFLNNDAINASWLWPKNFMDHYEALPINNIMSLQLLKVYHEEK